MKRANHVILLLIVLFLLACLWRMLAGVEFAWPVGEIADLRLKRLVSAVAVGSSLAVSGVLLQALLRNPLASPFILGLASGSGFGVVTGIWLGSVFTFSAGLVTYGILPALLGALAALGLVFLLGRRHGQIDPLSLVLVGVVISAVFGALSLFILHLLPPGKMALLMYWMMGRLSDDRGWPLVITICLLSVAGTVVSTLLGRSLDAMSLGDDEAISLGLPLYRLRSVLLVLSGLLTAGAVVLAGPIGFIGLISPHLVRLTTGPAHRRLVVGSALLGSVIVLSADSIVNSFRLSGGRLPIGIFTALVGGPVFLWILRSNWRENT